MRWPLVPIGDVVKIRGGGTPSRDNASYFNGDIPWVTPKDMKRWEIVGSQVRITQEAVQGSAATLIPTNTVLLVNRSGILKHTLPVALNRREVAINQDMKSLQCDARIIPEFLARFLKNSEQIILGWVRATTADNFPIKNIRQLQIPLPPIDEQRRIATILDTADALRAKRRSALAKLEMAVDSLFCEMFVFGGGHGWDERTIEEVSSDIRTGPFGSQLLHSEFVDEGVAVLGIDNAVLNEFSWDERRYITHMKYKKLSRYTVRPRDVIITLMGTCGRCAVVPDDIPLAINTKHLCCITFNQTIAMPEFMHAVLLRHPDVLRQLGVSAKGAVMPGLNMGIIKNLRFRLPPTNLQKAFCDRLAKIRSISVEARNGTKQLDDLFKSLQHHAFRGEL